MIRFTITAELRDPQYDEEHLSRQYLRGFQETAGGLFFHDTAISSWDVQEGIGEDVRDALVSLALAENPSDSNHAMIRLCGALGLPEPEWSNTYQRYVHEWETE